MQATQARQRRTAQLAVAAAAGTVVGGAAVAGARALLNTGRALSAAVHTGIADALTRGVLPSPTRPPAPPRG